MHQFRRHPLKATFAMTWAMLVFSGPAFADEEKPIDEKARTVLSSDIVTRLDTLPETQPNWLRANIHMRKKHGFEYSHRYKSRSRDADLIFSVQGPMLKKKTPGLRFEIRF